MRRDKKAARMSIKRLSLDKLAKRQSVNDCLLIENDDGAEMVKHGTRHLEEKNSIVGHGLTPLIASECLERNIFALICVANICRKC
jgi:hypothetical protein